MNVLISGGGIAGLTLAFWLHRHGHDPLIVDSRARLIVREAATRIATHPLASLVLKRRFAWANKIKL